MKWAVEKTDFRSESVRSGDSAKSSEGLVGMLGGRAGRVAPDLRLAAQADGQSKLTLRRCGGRAGIRELTTAASGSTFVAFFGRLDNRGALKARLGLNGDAADESPASIASRLLDRRGDGFLADLSGAFIIAIYDASRSRLILARDHLGVEACYYRHVRGQFTFGSRIADVLDAAGEAPSLDPRALAQTLLFNYNPSVQTVFQGVHKLLPGHLLIFEEGAIKTQCYWRPDFVHHHAGDEQELLDGLLTAMRRAVHEQRCPGGVAAFVSGGLDSSTVLSLAVEGISTPPNTYAYRCRGRGYDESHYARAMARAVGAVHHEVDYQPRDVLLMQQAAGFMDEPFSDSGINVASWLLGRVAGDATRVVLTGDGGDELFAGHPVYEADRMARLVDPLPTPVHVAMAALATRLPDSRRKKNLLVKVKRFCESMAFPRELLSNRWRVYYRTSELADLLHPDFANELPLEQVFDEVCERGRGGSGDPLARTLAADYLTVTDFYLRRNALLQAFDIQVRCPMLEPRLVQYCAAIPSRLKCKGGLGNKYLLRRIAEDLLPPQVAHRRDKLGHSVPLKNWLRESDEVRQFVLDHLSEQTVRRRGLVQPAAVQRLVNEHLAGRANHAHRLWMLAVLEMWCKSHLDR